MYEYRCFGSGDGWYVFRDRKVYKGLNDNRKQILDELSYILRDAGLPEIKFEDRKFY